MAKLPGHLDKIGKTNQKIHFSNYLWGGKGDHLRKQTKETLNNYKSNKFWETTEFEKKKRLKESSRSNLSE